MQRFKGYLQEMAQLSVNDLNAEFIRRAMKVTSFNLIGKDFESLEYKREIQHLFHINFFHKFDMNNTLQRVDETRLAKAIKDLRNSNSKGLEYTYRYNIKGVGPGEVMLYFLLDNAHLGGGSSAGLDLVDISGGYEVKAVDYSSNGKYVNNFKVGGTFSMAEIISGVQNLKKQTGGTGSEVNASDLAKIEKQFPGQLKKYYDMYAEVTYKNYFRNHKIIFLSNKKGGGYQLGDLIAIKQVQKSDIIFERITSGTIKPRIKI